MKNDEDAELLRLRFALDERIKLANALETIARVTALADDWQAGLDRSDEAGVPQGFTYDATRECLEELRAAIAAAPKLAGEE